MTISLLIESSTYDATNAPALDIGNPVFIAGPFVGDEIQHKDGRTFIVKKRTWLSPDNGEPHIRLTLSEIQRA